MRWLDKFRGLFGWRVLDTEPPVTQSGGKDMATIRRRTLISGRVQGVAFRAYTRQAARAAGVVGWVQNLPDGRVEAVFEGTPDRVQAMIDWCHHGPRGARVDKVEVIEERVRGDLTDFDIAYTKGWY